MQSAEDNKEENDDYNCVICCSLIYDATISCKEGHTICGGCFEALQDSKKPCYCRNALLDQPMPNRTLTNIISAKFSEPMRCPFGCDASVQYDDLKSHRTSCVKINKFFCLTYQPTHPQCCVRFRTFDELLTHYKTVHACGKREASRFCHFLDPEAPIEHDLGSIFDDSYNPFTGFKDLLRRIKSSSRITMPPNYQPWQFGLTIPVGQQQSGVMVKIFYGPFPWHGEITEAIYGNMIQWCVIAPKYMDGKFVRMRLYGQGAGSEFEIDNVCSMSIIEIDKERNQLNEALRGAPAVFGNHPSRHNHVLTSDDYIVSIPQALFVFEAMCMMSNTHQPKEILIDLVDDVHEEFNQMHMDVDLEDNDPRIPQSNSVMRTVRMQNPA